MSRGAKISYFASSYVEVDDGSSHFLGQRKVCVSADVAAIVQVNEQILLSRDEVPQ